ncbi:hypothetical protein CONLIGDRAFT_191039 [Coniochaeta ligniaria NRRL 30616]|uniref:Uncharacterized protein n=1 Tax=Coniochaeta ligniaria NRRL 30616 TaxID=1408157 RepID=A0A1J7J331_9PEZI|nr:hypothetical protein CONLIGDRAFT_191039 [Coniochaeta ligniaria NRRL 30616]
MAHPEFAFTTAAVLPNDPWAPSRSPVYTELYHNGGYDQQNHYQSPSGTYSRGAAPAHDVMASISHTRPIRGGRSDTGYTSTATRHSRSPTEAYGNANGAYGSHNMHSHSWDHQGAFLPSDSMEDVVTSPGFSEYPLDATAGTSPTGKGKPAGKGSRPQRRPSNRDEFDGPHQLLQRPPADYVAKQERELPHLPTNLLVQEQDSVLTQVNDRLSQCAFDFVAKYQFPIPIAPDMRPVERPQDREWTEWVYLLKRLATKRRIPARVLYNGQIKQFVTILENSLEMRHAAKHQSRPLKDDRNILQLISAGIQVAKILKDAQAMEYLDKLYVMTEQQIQERSAAAAARFR